MNLCGPLLLRRRPLERNPAIANSSGNVSDYGASVATVCTLTPYPTKLPAGSFWLGSEKLWTNRYIEAVWHGYWVTDPDSGLKHEIYYDEVFWWRKGYDWRTENPPPLKVTGKRLDAEAPSLYDDRANAAFIKIPAMLTGIDIPTVGCWEITGNYKDDELSFVVGVVP